MFKHADSRSGRGSLLASPLALRMHICPQGCIKVREQKRKDKSLSRKLTRLCSDAVKPLLISMSVFGIHYPIAYRLSKALKAIQEQREEHLTATSYFQQLVDRAVEWRKPAFQRPIFSDDEGVTRGQGVRSDHDELAGQALDTRAVALELYLDTEGEKALEGSWKRLSKGLDVDVQPEVSVREL